MDAPKTTVKPYPVNAFMRPRYPWSMVPRATPKIQMDQSKAPVMTRTSDPTISALQADLQRVSREMENLKMESAKKFERLEKRMDSRKVLQTKNEDSKILELQDVLKKLQKKQESRIQAIHKAYEEKQAEYQKKVMESTATIRKILHEKQERFEKEVKKGAKLREQVEVLKAELAESQSEMDALCDEYSEKEEIIDEKTLEINDLHHQYQALSETLSKMRNEIERDDCEMKILKDEKKELQKENLELKERIQNREKEMRQMRKELREVRKIAEERDEMIGKELEETREKVEETKGNMEESKKKLVEEDLD